MKRDVSARKQAVADKKKRISARKEDLEEMRNNARRAAQLAEAVAQQEDAIAAKEQFLRDNWDNLSEGERRQAQDEIRLMKEDHILLAGRTIIKHLGLLTDI